MVNFHRSYALFLTKKTKSHIPSASVLGKQNKQMLLFFLGSAITSLVSRVAWESRNGEHEIRKRNVNEKIQFDKNDSFSKCWFIKVVIVIIIEREKNRQGLESTSVVYFFIYVFSPAKELLHLKFCIRHVDKGPIFTVKR